MYCLIPLLVLTSNVLDSLTSKPYYHTAQAEKFFVEFVVAQERDYGGHDEIIKRLNIFKTKLQQLNHWNQIHEGTFVINPFTDMLHEEFAETHYGLDFEMDNRYNVTKVEVKREWLVNASRSLDYREEGLVTKVKNQRNCRCSNIFSAIGNIEGQHAKNHGVLISLSNQQGIDCTETECDTGGLIQNTMEELASQGCMSEVDYPYVGYREICQTDFTKIKVIVNGFEQLGSTEQELRAALVKYGPLATGMYMPDYMMHLKGNAVLSPKDCVIDPSVGHAILIVGYGTDSDSGKNYWIIKNSWGAEWGDNGYFYLESDKGHCGLAEMGVFNAVLGEVVVDEEARNQERDNVEFD